ncbi:MAG: hypothetical protein ACLS8R_01240 [Anaeromassilibacillus sp.]
MAGKEQNGFAASDADLFDGASYILVLRRAAARGGHLKRSPSNWAGRDGRDHTGASTP